MAESIHLKCMVPYPILQLFDRYVNRTQLTGSCFQNIFNRFLSQIQRKQLYAATLHIRYYIKARKIGYSLCELAKSTTSS